MQKVKGYKLSISLSPVELIWLHSHHHFMKIEEDTKVDNNEIKFYKVNGGVQIRFESVGEEPDFSVPQRAKEAIETIVAQNEIRLLDVSLIREVYVKVAKEARRQFSNAYIIFLHYDTFENCCRRLKEKFGVTSPFAQFQRLKQQNHHFCFLICDKQYFQAVFNYTHKLLNMQISCASTSISNKRDRGSLDHDTISLSKRAHSVTSLRGSFTSCDNDTHTEPEQRLSLNNSEAGEEIYEIGETVVQNLEKGQLNGIVRSKMYFGSHVDVEYAQGSYLDIKKRLYYANRLQMFPNPFIQQVFAYGVGQSVNSWYAYFIVEKTSGNLRNEIYKTRWHHPRKKVQLVIAICKALDFLHRNRQTHGQITPQNIKFDRDQRILLSGTPNKNIPPHTNPFQYDIRLLLVLIYWIATQIELSYEAIMKKISNKDLLFSMLQRVRHPTLMAFYDCSNELISRTVDLQGYIARLQAIPDL